MTKKKSNFNLYYVSLAILSLVVGYVFRVEAPIPNTADDYSFLETSMVSILGSILDETIPDDLDLGIDQIILKKISDPKSDFNYYKYNATVMLHNYGGDLRNAKVILHTDSDRNYLFLKNTADGFSLKAGEDYPVRGYEVLFDGRYNGGDINFKIEIQNEDENRTDVNDSNNEFGIEIFEFPPKLKSLSVDKFLEDGSFYLNFDEEEHVFSSNDFITYFSDTLSYRDTSLRYREVYTLNDLYPHYWLNTSLNLLESGHWSATRNSELDPEYIQPKEDILDPKNESYFYVKSIDEDSGYFKISDILAFLPQEEMDRAQFSRVFVDTLGLELTENDVNLYEDVDAEEWYGPAVQTIYNLGLTDINKFQYLPSEKITRAEVLKVVLDYFDVDLVFDDFDQRFEDIAEDDLIYPYAQALSADKKGTELADYFEPDSIATKSFLKYLINEYR